jgi:peptidoglycan/LPS O-acetylase OafA/YrhL
MISNHEFMYYRSHLRMDSILFGSVLAVWQNPILDGARAWRPGWASFVLALALLVFTLAYRDPAFREILRYSVQGIGLFVVYSFIMARKSFMNTILKLPPFQLIGRYSYAIYLVHVPILFMVEQNLTSTHALWRGLLAAMLTLVISGLIHVIVEKPAARLRHAFSSAATPGEKPAPLQAAT